MPPRHMSRIPGQQENIGVVGFHDFRTFLSLRRELQVTEWSERIVENG